jgi:hypothetical protein
MFDFAFTGTLPDFSLPPAKIAEKYGSIQKAYERAGQYYALAFNKTGVKFATDETAPTNATEFDEITRNFLMFHGLHKTTTFNFLNMVFDDTGSQTNAAIPVRPGQDAATIFLFLQGLFLQVANNADAHAMVMNQDLKNKITDKFKMVEIQRKFGDFLQVIEKATNSKFNAPASPSAGQDAIMKAVFNSYGTGLQKDANLLWAYIRENSATFSDMLRAYTNMLVGRRAVLHVEDNGLLRVFNPKYYAATSTDDDDFGRYDRSRSVIFQMDKEDAAEMYKKDLTKEQYDYIRSTNFSNVMPFNSMIVPQYNYNLYTPDSNKITIVRSYFRSVADSRYMKDYNSETNQYELKALKYGSKKGGEVIPVMRKVDMIANIAAVNFGIDSVVEDPNHFGNKIFRLMCFQPNTYDGINVCLADRVMTKQEQVDAVESRINEFFSQDLGNIVEFIGSQFDNGIDPLKIWGQLKRAKIHIRKSSPNIEDPTNRMASMNIINASLMKDIQEYISLKNSFKNDIREIANVNNVTMGTPGEYVGFKTQQNSVALATNSVQYGIVGVLALFADAGSFGIEQMRKNVIKDPKNPIYVNLLGDDGIQRIIDAKDIPYSKWLLRLKFNDILDPARKERILRFLEALAANGNASFKDFLNVEEAKTISELKDAASYAEQSKEYKQMLMAAAAAQAKNEGIQQMAEGQIMKEQVAIDGQMAAGQQQGMFDLAGEAMKQTGDPNAAAAVMAPQMTEPQQQMQ